mgnify:CR=1 FL=1
MKTWQKYAIYVVPLLLVGFLLFYFSDIVSYIILAWVVSMIGAPLYRLLNRFLKKSGLAAGLTLLVMTMALIIILRIFIPPLFDQARKLAGIDYEKILVSLEEPIADLKGWMGDKGFFSEDQALDAEHKHDENGNHYLKTEVINIDSLVYDKTDSLHRPINIVVNISGDNPHHNTIDNKGSPNSYFEGLRSNIFEMFNSVH